MVQKLAGFASFFVWVVFLGGDGDVVFVCVCVCEIILWWLGLVECIPPSACEQISRDRLLPSLRSLGSNSGPQAW